MSEHQFRLRMPWTQPLFIDSQDMLEPLFSLFIPLLIIREERQVRSGALAPDPVPPRRV